LEKIAKRIAALRVLKRELRATRICLADLGRIIITPRARTEQIGCDIGRARRDDFVDVAFKIRRERAERAVAIVVEQKALGRRGRVRVDEQLRENTEQTNNAEKIKARGGSHGDCV
jgi:hypothetical protein